jgi:hypothetical protein
MIAKTEKGQAGKARRAARRLEYDTGFVACRVHPDQQCIRRRYISGGVRKCLRCTWPAGMPYVDRDRGYIFGNGALPRSVWEDAHSIHPIFRMGEYITKLPTKNRGIIYRVLTVNTAGDLVEVL